MLEHLATGVTALKRCEEAQPHVLSGFRQGAAAALQPPVEMDRMSTPLLTPSVASCRKNARSVEAEDAKTPV